ncbi:MAG TPA: BioY family transporter [Gemmatimonadetes bacterium]|nr:BioY family transporter [Gemmatimonadota bacterium]|tara:strand:- start:19552 stop:20142 length:591 start_codon:yes stop_codon:yes gene_type:complete
MQVGPGNAARDFALFPVVDDRRARIGIAMVAFVVATSFGAQVAVPLPWTPVPMTLQPLFVILAGAVLGPRLGATTMATYLAVGMGGAPVFAQGHAGIGWLLGPTGGYLISYPAAAYVSGLLAGKASASALRLFGALSAGMLIIYVGGTAQLAFLTQLDLQTVMTLSVLPFLGGDLTKVLIGVFVAKKVRPTSLARL